MKRIVLLLLILLFSCQSPEYIKQRMKEEYSGNSIYMLFPQDKWSEQIGFIVIDNEGCARVVVERQFKNSKVFSQYKIYLKRIQ